MNPCDRPAVYRIVIAGQLDDRWADWFRDMSLAHVTDARAERATVLEGRVPDQAALRGLLACVWDLGLVVIEVSRTPETPDRAQPPGTTEARQER